MKKVIMIRYGEIGLKGRNRSDFEKRLLENIKTTFGKEVDIHIRHKRLILPVVDEETLKLYERLRFVAGIQSYSLAYMTDRSKDQILKAIIELVENEKDGVSTFKVETRRSYKKFPWSSMEFSALMGEEILKRFPYLKVNLKEPDLLIGVEIREEGAYVFTEKAKGMGGLPVGSSGKGMVLLSGGIDSPVAAWMMMKRGVRIEAVHFASPPYTGEQAREKVFDICRVLARYSNGFLTLHIVPFTKLQLSIHRSVPTKYSLVAQRRAMVRIAEKLASRRRADVLITGENLGQVGSQTIENMKTISSAASIMVLRPLVGLDKQEIIALARTLETYEISIRPFEDCCTIFVPKHPATRSTPELLENLEKNIPDYEKLIEEAIENVETFDVEAVW
ncbi:MAG: tRNA 4-thiouridine(8) synthase ThiI [Thermotogae bacterium]|nr:tRNA 4-thiouridine(8) synthase ThiI [Thermotogota bacterium]